MCFVKGLLVFCGEVPSHLCVNFSANCLAQGFHRFHECRWVIKSWSFSSRPHPQRPPFIQWYSVGTEYLATCWGSNSSTKNIFKTNSSNQVTDLHKTNSQKFSPFRPESKPHSLQLRKHGVTSFTTFRLIMMASHVLLLKQLPWSQRYPNHFTTIQSVQSAAESPSFGPSGRWMTFATLPKPQPRHCSAAGDCIDARPKALAVEQPSAGEHSGSEHSEKAREPPEDPWRIGIVLNLFGVFYVSVVDFGVFSVIFFRVFPVVLMSGWFNMVSQRFKMLRLAVGVDL